ncbi:MAG: methyltransferase domain-containing protein [Ignavibacteriae bacterium]|nr:methyltransferase domain-containing protein [Ignavibacteriota bacterium]
MKQSSEYLLGVSKTELERLRFQHSVWKSVTDRFFDRLNIQRGWKCLDVGSGPGFVSFDLRERVGDEGEITGLEPSEFYLERFKEQCVKKGWTNVKFIHGTAETAQLPERYYDLIFARWVISFVPDPERFLERLCSALRAGGVIALQDYIYDGLNFFPRGGAFDGMLDAVRAYWYSGGGDPDVAARIPSLFKKYDVRLIDYTPNCLAGDGSSPIAEWAHRFFTTHIHSMVEKGIITKDQGDAMWEDWLAHRKNPQAIFFSPIVVDMAGILL